MRFIILLLTLSSLAFSNLALPDNFKADFEQRITNTKKRVIQYEGSVLFSDHTFFKWTYVSPTKKEVCTDGSELLVVDHDLEQVSFYYITKGLDIAKIVEESREHSKNIYVAVYEGKTYTLKVDSAKRLHSMAYYDALDNKVQIIFKNIKYGKGKLASEKMQCNYPDDYDRIRG